MTRDISTLRDKTTGRRGCYQSTRYDGLLRVKEFGTGRFFYIKPQNAVLELQPRTLANKRKESMSYGSESIRNRHRPGIVVQDTRVYAGPTKIGPMRKTTDNDTLEKTRKHKYDRGDKVIDGVPREEFQI